MTYGAGLQGQTVYLPAPGPKVMNLVLTLQSQPSQCPRKELSPLPSTTPQVHVFGTLHNSGRQFQAFIACERGRQTLDVLLRPWESWCCFQGSIRAHWETWEKKHQRTPPWSEKAVALGRGRRRISRNGRRLLAGSHKASQKVLGVCK